MSKFKLEDFKFEQIATVVNSLDDAGTIMRVIGGDWVEDFATLETKVFIGPRAHDKAAKSVYKLFFNYGMALEYEILLPLSGPCWLHTDVIPPTRRISHAGTHVSGNAHEVGRRAARSMGVQVAQESTSLSHTNPYLVEQGRKYRYSIINTQNLLGFDLKFIERIDPIEF